MLFILTTKIHELFHCNTKKVSQSLMNFKNSWVILTINQTRKEQTRGVSFVVSWLHDNGIEIYLTHNKEKSVAVLSKP